MTTSNVPELDEELRLRLGRRFGSAIDAWFAALPAGLDDLAERWDIEWDAVIQRGSMSVVIRCRAGDGRRAVLKRLPSASGSRMRRPRSPAGRRVMFPPCSLSMRVSARF